MLSDPIQQIDTASSVRDAYANRLLCLSVDIGEKILECGGEIHRVENTIERICRAYGAVHVEVFVIPTLILASIRMADNGYSSQVRRVTGTFNDLARLESFNSISRRVCVTTPPLEELDAIIKQEKEKKPVPLWMTMLSYSLVAGAFTVLFGGNLWDALAGALVGILLAPVSRIKGEYINQMARTLIMSFLAGSLSYLCVLLSIGQHIDMVMIGTIMLLIPGLAFGNAIRDLLCGDTVAGLLKTVQSGLLTIMIVLGYALSIFLLGNGVANVPVTEGMPPLVVWLAVPIGTFGFSMMFHVKARHLCLISIAGVLNYGVYVLALQVGFSLFVAAFFSGLFFTVCSEVSARIFRTPAAVFLYTIPIAIVPGGSLYYTVSSILMGNMNAMPGHLQTTLYVSFGIAAGIVAVSVLMQFFLRLKAKSK